MEQSTVDIQALAGDVATHLGEGWTCELPNEEFGERVAYLRHRDGHGLHLSRNWRDKSRLVVSGFHPTTRDGRSIGTPYGKTWPEITVAHGRGAATIAKEIERRLLPAYLELWADLSEQARSSDEYEDGKELAKLKIMAAVPLDFGTRHNTDTADFRFKNGGDFYGNVKVSGPNSVHIEIHGISLKRGLEVLRTLLGPRDFAAQIAGVDASIAKENAEWKDVRGTLSDTGMERFDRRHEQFIQTLQERRAELEQLAERVKGLEVAE